MYSNLDAIRVATRDDSFTVLDVVAQYAPNVRIWFGEDKIDIHVDSHLDLEDIKSIISDLKGQVNSEIFISEVDYATGDSYSCGVIKTKEWTIDDVEIHVDKVIVPLDTNMSEVLRAIRKNFEIKFTNMFDDMVHIYIGKRVNVKEFIAIKDEIPGKISTCSLIGGRTLEVSLFENATLNSLDIPDDLREELEELLR